MKAKTMLKKLKDILSAERHAQMAKYSSLKKVLKALRKEKVRLENKLTKAKTEEEQQKITSRLKVISAQRKKGLRVLKELKLEREKAKD